MADNQTFVIVGGGLAGAKAAETLRDEGFDGVVIVGGGAERRTSARRYPRATWPATSPRDDARVHDEGYYDEHDVELMRGRGDRLDPGAPRVTLATEASPLRPPADRDGRRAARPPIDGADAEAC